MTKDLELLELGFKEYAIPDNEDGRAFYKLADRFFQLKVIDNPIRQHIKYFVDVYYYDFKVLHRRISLLFSIRFNANGKEIVVEFSDSNFSSSKEILIWIENFWFHNNFGIDLHNN